MSTEDKVYMNYGYKIVRKYHYVDAHQHYDYIVDMDGKKKTFSSLKQAKQYISDVLHGRAND
jgi:hypothetical protein